jgi:acetyl-CoA C-acetyltransferase
MARDQVAIIGAGMTMFGENFDASLEQLAEAFVAAVESVDRGLDVAEIGYAYFGNVIGSLQGNEIPSGATLTNAIGLPGLGATRVENGCPTGSDAVRQAYQAVVSGMADVVVVVGAEKLRERSTRSSLLESGRMGHPVLSYGMTATTLFGHQVNRHMHTYGTTSEQLALVAVKNWANASRNEHAQRQQTLTVQQVLASPVVCSPFTVLDCCPQSDGAAAVILCRGDLASRFTDRPVRVAGLGLATDALYLHEKRRHTGWDCTRLAAERAYAMAGISAEQVDVAEVHDCFTGVEIINYEDLGLCPAGEGGQFVEAGETQVGGTVPVNPSGGLLAKGHPIGATGVAQMVELFTQLRQDAGERQVAFDDGFALQHNLGGYSAGISVVTVLTRD